MANNIGCTMITYLDQDGLIKYWGWEISTRSCIMTNQNPITDSKNTCRNSLVFHAHKYFGLKMSNTKIKQREIQL